jgi:hypothetical protein
VEAKEGGNGLMDLLGIKSTTKKWKRKKDRHCGRSYRCSGSSLRHNSSQRVDRGRRKSKKKKKSTTCNVIPHPSISILYFFTLFVYISFLIVVVEGSQKVNVHSLDVDRRRSTYRSVAEGLIPFVVILTSDSCKIPLSGFSSIRFLLFKWNIGRTYSGLHWARNWRRI